MGPLARPLTCSLGPECSWARDKGAGGGAGMGSNRAQTFILLCPPLLPQSLPVLLSGITHQPCHSPEGTR